MLLAFLAAEPSCQQQPATRKACDTRLVEGPTVKFGQAYARTISMCDQIPEAHVVELALWRKVGDTFEAQSIHVGNVVSWFTLCGDKPFPGNDAECEVHVECVSGIYQVRVHVTGTLDGLPFAWTMPEDEQLVAELRCPKR